MKGFLVSTNSSKEINNPHWLSQKNNPHWLSCVIILIGKSDFAILKIIISSLTWHRSLAMRVWWINFFFLRNKLVYFAEVLLILFTVLVLFSTFIYLFIYSISYSTVVYSCCDICNNHSCCDHTLCLAHNTHIRTRLHWISLTCAQTSLKPNLSKASPNTLTLD